MSAQQQRQKQSQNQLKYKINYQSKREQQYTDEQMEYLIMYTQYDMQKLKLIVHETLTLIGGIVQSQYDDFYSLANIELYKAVMTYDSAKCDKFHFYLKGNIERKIKTYIRDIHASKRCNKYETTDENGNRKVMFHKDISLSQPVGEEDSGITMEDTVPDERHESCKNRDLSDEMLCYLSGLTKMQRRILYMLENGMKPVEIKQKLNISGEKYGELYKDLKKFSKTCALQDKWKIGN